MQIHLKRTSALLWLSISTPGWGGEGASSNYFPGTYGDYAVAAAPSQGWTYANYNLFYSAEVDRTILQGRVNTNLDTFAYINMSLLLYAFEEPVLGTQFAAGAFLPIGYADLQSSVTGPLTTIAADDSETNLGDIAILPASYNDPQERENVLFPNTWVPKAAMVQLGEHVASLRANPPIAPGTKDPYEPPR